MHELCLHPVAHRIAYQGETAWGTRAGAFSAECKQAVTTVIFAVLASDTATTWEKGTQSINTPLSEQGDERPLKFLWDDVGGKHVSPYLASKA